MMGFVKKLFSGLLITACVGCLFLSCSKAFVETDPATGTAPITLTSSTGGCSIIRIAQKNRSNSSFDNSFQIDRDTLFSPLRISSYDSLAGKNDFIITLTKQNDTTKLSTGEYFVTDPSSKLVNTFYTKEDISDPNSDDKLCKYFYNAQGYLIKKQIYVNASVLPFYETIYSYDNNLLTSCVLYVGTGRVKLLESTIGYDTTRTIKPWVYLYPDFFEGYNYLQAFNFGKKAVRPVQTIQTKIFDTNDGSIFDIWTTNFTGFVFSNDGYVLQTTATGDQQQGLGLLYGITRFDYQCSK